MTDKIEAPWSGKETCDYLIAKMEKRWPPDGELAKLREELKRQRKIADDSYRHMVEARDELFSLEHRSVPQPTDRELATAANNCTARRHGYGYTPADLDALTAAIAALRKNHKPDSKTRTMTQRGEFTGGDGRTETVEMTIDEIKDVADSYAETCSEQLDRIRELESDQTHTARRLKDALDNGTELANRSIKFEAENERLRGALENIANCERDDAGPCPYCTGGARAALTPPVDEKADEFGLDLGLKPDATVRVKARVEDLSPPPDLVALVREWQRCYKNEYPSTEATANANLALAAFDLTAHRKAPDAS